MIAAYPDIRVDSGPLADKSATDAVAPSTDTLPDHELMLAVRDGELDALGELFERHHGPLYGFLVKFTGSRSAAEAW